MVIERSYETFAIEWNDGSRWSGYESAAEAEAVAGRSSRDAEVARSVFTVWISPERLHLYQPGIGDKVLDDPGR
jgi:hypothetical protein